MELAKNHREVCSNVKDRILVESDTFVPFVSKNVVSVSDRVSIEHELWTTDCGLRTGYKIRTRYKTRTGKYGLGMKHGLGIKRGLRTADWV